ncbi:MAG: hypothetical protein IJ057_00955, partial [Bacteroidales bacterium]|nr:hypothetical protein [Bacteroidales bacterium]
MKKKVFSLMMTLVLAFMGVAQAETIEIGTGTSASYYIPFNSLYGYSFTEQVYPASEIGTAGSISSISFYLNQSYTEAQVNSTALYMKNVSRTTFSSTTDYETVTAGDMVYSGMWTIPANYTGWVTINLDTPFAYDGTSNLMVAMHEYTSGYSTRYFTYTSVTNCAIQWYSDSYDPNPYALDSYTGSKALRSYLANAQLDITSGGGAIGSTVVDFETGDFSQADFSNDASHPWVISTSSPHSGNYCMRSGCEGVSNGTSTMEATVSFAVDGSVSFYSRVSSESVSYDWGAFYIDGAEQFREGGTVAWGVHTYEVTAGEHTFRWYYRKDGSVDGGEDSWFVDDITFRGTSVSGGDGDQLHVRFVNAEGEEVVDSLNLGVRPMGAWMEPFEFTMYSEGPTYTVTVLDFTPDDGMFS